MKYPFWFCWAHIYSQWLSKICPCFGQAGPFRGLRARIRTTKGSRGHSLQIAHTLVSVVLTIG